MKKIRKSPIFKSLEEEAFFWDTHNMIDLTLISRKELKELGIHPNYSAKRSLRKNNMGMFNILKTDKVCPRCGSVLEWQTKNLVIDNIYPVDNLLLVFDLNKRTTAEAYAVCKRCNI